MHKQRELRAKRKRTKSERELPNSRPKMLNWTKISSKKKILFERKTLLTREKFKLRTWEDTLRTLRITKNIWSKRSKKLPSKSRIIIQKSKPLSIRLLSVMPRFKWRSMSKISLNKMLNWLESLNRLLNYRPSRKSDLKKWSSINNLMSCICKDLLFLLPCNHHMLSPILSGLSLINSKTPSKIKREEPKLKHKFNTMMIKFRNSKKDLMSSIRRLKIWTKRETKKNVKLKPKLKLLLWRRNKKKPMMLWRNKRERLKISQVKLII